MKEYLKEVIIDTILITMIVFVIIIPMSFLMRKLFFPSPRTQVYFIENNSSIENNSLKYGVPYTLYDNGEFHELNFWEKIVNKLF